MGKKSGAAKKADASVIDQVSGIDLARVDSKMVDAYIEKLGIDLEGGGTSTERVRKLSAFFREKVVADNSATCTTCQGKSDTRLAVCPFCGDGETGAEIEAGTVDEEAAIRELRGEPAAEPQARKRRRFEAAAEKIAAPISIAEARAKKETEPFRAEIVPSTDGPKTSIVEVEDKGATVADLDSSVAKIHSLNGQVYEATWDLGKELADNFRRKLWLQRRVDGKPVYKGWADFVKAEVPCSVAQTYRLMDAATTFERSAFREHGIKKLLLLLTVPEEERPAMVEAARDLSVRQLQSKIVENLGGAVSQAKETRVGDRKEDVGASNTDLGKAITNKQWGRAIDLLTMAAVAAGSPSLEEFRTDFARRAVVSEKLGIDVRTLRRWMATLEEAGAFTGSFSTASANSRGLIGVPDEPAAKPKKAAAPPPEKGKKAPPAAPATYAVPMQVGRVKLPLFARPAKKGAPEKRAKKLADDPFAIEVHENSMTIRYTVQANRKGELELVIDRVRA